MPNKEKYEKELFEIGLKAALKHSKAKLWAKVNHCDNFCLAIRGTVEQAILDEAILFLTDEDTEWLNLVCKNNEKELKIFIKKIAQTAYEKLT